MVSMIETLIEKQHAYHGQEYENSGKYYVHPLTLCIDLAYGMPYLKFGGNYYLAPISGPAFCNEPDQFTRSRDPHGIRILFYRCKLGIPQPDQIHSVIAAI